MRKKINFYTLLVFVNFTLFTASAQTDYPPNNTTFPEDTLTINKSLVKDFSKTKSQNPTADNTQPSAIIQQQGITLQNERNINSASFEYGPSFYENGIVFISSQVYKKEKVYHGRAILKTMSIFLSRRGKDGSLQKPVAFNEFPSSKLNEGPPTFDITKDNIFFTRNVNVGKNDEKIDDIPRLKIYTAEKRGTSWSEPVEMPFNENTSDACHPSLSVDGDKIYFSSNRPGGYGGMDLYVCEKIGGKWGKSVNMGPKINTPKNEVVPFIHADGTLFFASDGLPGNGGLDIFYVKTSKAQQELPVNIGAPFNTSSDDFGFIIDADMKNGYFTSNRAGGIGGDDIYSFNTHQGDLFNNLKESFPVSLDKTVDVVEVLQPINVLGYDRQTGKPIKDAAVSYVNLENINASGINGSIGDKFIDLESKMNVSSSSNFTINTGSSFIMKNIYYNFDDAEIRPEAFKDLDALYTLMRTYPDMEIELSSHTDCRGTDLYNLDLSQRRAASIVQYLALKGIAINRMTAKGYGKKFIINGCTESVSCSENQHKVNRRTEFKITKSGSAQGKIFTELFSPDLLLGSQ